MGLRIDELEIRSFAAHRRAEVYDLAVDFFRVVVYEAHIFEPLTIWIVKDIVDLLVGNICE